MAHKLAKKLTEVRKKQMKYLLGPDGKTQVTVEYENNKPKRIETILISTQHLKTATLKRSKRSSNRKSN